MKNKIKVNTQWDEKFLRETPFMPFGSLCNLIGQAYQGKGIDEETLEKLARKAFELCLEFTERSYNVVEREEQEIEVKTKNG
jgi:hypothetical protein